MKTLIIAASALLLASCKGPSAGMEISNRNPAVNESILVENISAGGEITYIRMNGEGMMNEHIPVGKNANITDPSFHFVYTKAGNYTVQVFVESSEMLGGTTLSSRSYEVVVAEPSKPNTTTPITHPHTLSTHAITNYNE